MSSVTGSFSFDLNSRGYSDIVQLLREERQRGAGHRYMVHQSTRSHFTLNMLAHAAGAAGLISYSRGYHDTLSFWHLEHFSWSPAQFRLYNVKHVVVAKKKILQVPSYISTVFPSCPANLTLDSCIAQLGSGYSLHEVNGEFGLAEIVSSPLLVCSARGLKSPALRYLLLNITRGMYEQGMLPRLSWEGCPEGGGGRDGEDGEYDVVDVLGSNWEYIRRKSLEGPEVLFRTVEKFGVYELRLSGMEAIKAGLEQVGKLVQVAVESRWAGRMEMSGRRMCEVVREEERYAGEVAVRLRCEGGYRALRWDVLLLKTSFHSLWTVTAKSHEHVEREVRHFPVSPNLIGVSMFDFGDLLQSGKEVELLFAFHNPRDQHVMFVLSMVTIFFVLFQISREAFRRFATQISKATSLFSHFKRDSRRFRERKAE